MRDEVMQVGREAYEGWNHQARKRGEAQEAMMARIGRRWRVYILYICSEGWSFYTLVGSVLELHIEMLSPAIYLLFKSLNFLSRSC